MTRVNVNIFPRGGYFFKEADGTTIRSNEGWNSVIARVAAYRKRNGLPPGNPLVEVHAQGCHNNPQLCTHESEAQMHQTRVVSLKGRILAWLSKMVAHNQQEPFTYVSAEEAARRANICASCPLNTGINEGCRSCRAAMQELSRGVIGGRLQDSRLVGCLVTGEHLASAVWIDGQQTVDNGELPGHCWRRRGL